MYRKRKTIEAAAYLLAKADGEMPYIKLVKLLYLADREQIRQRGRSISGDSHWSLKYGPVLEHTLDAIRHGDSEWGEVTQTDLEAKVISLRAEVPACELSRADCQVLDQVYAEFGSMKWPQLVDHTHGLAEWVPTSGRRRISLRDIAKAVGHSDERIAEILEADRERAEIERLRILLEETPARV